MDVVSIDRDVIVSCRRCFSAGEVTPEVQGRWSFFMDMKQKRSQPRANGRKKDVCVFGGRRGTGGGVGEAEKINICAYF